MERFDRGRQTRRPRAGTDEKFEATLQTLNGQRKALGQEMLPIPEALRSRLQAKFEASVK